MCGSLPLLQTGAGDLNHTVIVFPEVWTSLILQEDPSVLISNPATGCPFLAVMSREYESTPPRLSTTVNTTVKTWLAAAVVYTWVKGASDWEESEL